MTQKLQKTPDEAQERVAVSKCIVFGCSNNTSQGRFIGVLCAPCHHYITTGKIGCTDSFLGDMRAAIETLKRHVAERPSSETPPMNALIATATRWRRSLERLVRRFVRWKYVILTHRDYANRLNRSVEVENVLLACAAGKRDMLSKDECRQLAVKLGVPECFRSPNNQAER